MEEPAAQFVEIARTRDLDRAHELGLVVLSQRCKYWVVMEGDAYALLVRAEEAAFLRRQLEQYQNDAASWPPPKPELLERATTAAAAAIWLLVLLLAYGASLLWPDLYEAGKLSAEAVMRGEVYRALTALLLHGDFGHLAGNMAFGAVFIHLVARFTGNWQALGAVFAAGFLGNLLNAWLYHPADHFSIGASTAVFGAVGILVAIPAAFALRHAGVRLFQLWAVPLVVGLVFLAWFGTGSEKTDTSAHLTGFLCGLPLGALWGFTHPPRIRQNTAARPAG